MTREDALKLKIGKSKIYIADSGLEETYEATVIGIRLNIPSNPNSALEITGWCKLMSARVYNPGEICDTKVGALRKLADVYTLRSDQNLTKRHAVCEKIAKLKGGRDG
jgi:hypothetical protein